MTMSKELSSKSETTMAALGVFGDNVRKNYVKAKQVEFLNHLVRDFDIVKAMERAGVTEKALARWINDDDFIAYRDKLFKWYENGSQLNEMYVKARIFEALEGGAKLTREHVRVLEIGARMYNMEKKKQKDPFAEADEFVLMAQKGHTAKDVTDSAKTDGNIIDAESDS